MAQNEAQRRASRAVAAWMAHHQRDIGWLSRQAGADPGTIGDFLNGQRWPKLRTQGKLEKALGWPAGTITAIADGGDPPPLQADAAVGPVGDDDGLLLYRKPSGLTDVQWAELRVELGDYIEWQIERASRER